LRGGKRGGGGNGTLRHRQAVANQSGGVYERGVGEGGFLANIPVRRYQKVSHAETKEEGNGDNGADSRVIVGRKVGIVRQRGKKGKKVARNARSILVKGGREHGIFTIKTSLRGAKNGGTAGEDASTPLVDPTMASAPANLDTKRGTPKRMPAKRGTANKPWGQWEDKAFPETYAMRKKTALGKLSSTASKLSKKKKVEKS